MIFLNMNQSNDYFDVNEALADFKLMVCGEVAELADANGLEPRPTTRKTVSKRRRLQVVSPRSALLIDDFRNAASFILLAFQNSSELISDENRDYFNRLYEALIDGLVNLEYYNPSDGIVLEPLVPKFIDVHACLKNLGGRVEVFTALFGFEPHEVQEMAEVLLPEIVSVKKRGKCVQE